MLRPFGMCFSVESGKKNQRLWWNKELVDEMLVLVPQMIDVFLSRLISPDFMLVGRIFKKQCKMYEFETLQWKA